MRGAPFKLGEIEGENVIILSGLRPGERVVTHGALFLGDQSNSGG